MIKNLTLRQLSITVTLILVIVNSLLIGVFYFFSQLSMPTLLLGVVIVTAFILSFVAITSLLERFLIDRIKVIYKLIRSNKIGNAELETEQVQRLKMYQVNDDVVSWAQNANKEIAELQSLEQYRRDFVGNVSHELKTPIFTIQGYLHTLQEGGMYNEAVAKDYLGRAMRNIDRLQNIVEDLEIIHKLESEGKAVEMTEWQIADLVDETFIDLSEQAQAKSIKLRFADNAKHDFKVSANREMIRQVLNNLITNALKYSNEHTSVEVGLYELDDQILVEVADRGMGIEARHLKHLFDRFYRVDSARTRHIGGSGLGLSIVKHILEAHGQSVHVRSTSGIGSTFSFTLAKSK